MNTDSKFASMRRETFRLGAGLIGAVPALLRAPRPAALTAISGSLTGTLDMSEYLNARFTAKRHLLGGEPG